MREFDALTREISTCRDCRNLFGFEPRPVFQGSRNSKIMQISQAPSRSASATSRSFNDASGRRLRHDWYGISEEEFYDKGNFYISGIAHCYPGKERNGGDRRPPLHCADKWLWREIGLVDNSLFVLIGRYAAQYFFPKANFRELVFSDQDLNGKRAIVLPHPSPLNIKWFKDNPMFEKRRIPRVRKAVRDALMG